MSGFDGSAELGIAARGSVRSKRRASPMIAVGVLLQVTVAAPLDTARSFLARGDTASAVAALVGQASDRMDSLSGDRLLAVLLLHWIGRSPSQPRANQAWRAAGDAARRADRPAPAVAVLAMARMLETDPTVESTHLDSRDQWLGDVADQWGVRDPPLAAAAQWVRVQQFLALPARWSTPHYRPVPLHCRGGQPTCTIREPPPRSATLAGLTDSAGRPLLDDLRARIALARRTGWPVTELAARIGVALEAMVGDSGRLREAAEDTSGLDPRTARGIRTIALTLSGDPESAWVTMAADSAHFARLDSVLPHLVTPTTLSPEAFWWVAWPLYLQPYNERLVEHRARVLLSDPVERSRAFGLWADRDRMLRIGVPLGLELVREGSPGYPLDRDLVVTYLPSTFRETLVRLTDTAGAPPLDLALTARDDDLRLTTMSGFAPRAYDDFDPFEHQAFQYVRAGQRVVDIHGLRPQPRGRLCRGSGAEVGFFMQDGSLRPIGEKRETPDPTKERFFFRILPAAGQYVYSLEYLHRSCRFAARARHVLVVEDPARAMSGLVLTDSLLADEPHRAPADPLVVVRPSRRVFVGAPVHLYWEVYGLGPAAAGRALQVTLEVITVARQRVPVYQLSRLMPEARGAPQIALTFELRVPEGEGPLGIPLSLLLSGEVTGVHIVRVTVKDPVGRAEYRAERPFSVEPRG